MRCFASQYDFAYSWDEVSTNNWRKYCPWNDQSQHVIAVDTLSRVLDPTTKILRTERIITCQQSAPRWLRGFLGAQDTSFVYEISHVDPVTRRVTMHSQNLTWSDLLSVRETVVYSPGREPDTTTFEQQARVTVRCGGWAKVRNKMEDFTIQRFSQNAVRGREGFERVLAMSREAFAEQREQARREPRAA